MQFMHFKHIEHKHKFKFFVMYKIVLFTFCYILVCFAFVESCMNHTLDVSDILTLFVICQSELFFLMPS